MSLTRFLFLTLVYFSMSPVNAALQTPTQVWAVESQSNEVYLSWDYVSGANEYNVYIDDNYIDTVKNLNWFTAQNLPNGKHSFYVTALHNSNEVSQKSENIIINVGSGDEPTSFQPTVTEPTPTNLDTTMVDPLTPKGEKLNFQLVFSDEFENYFLDSAKWNTQALWGENIIINNEKQYYVNLFKANLRETTRFNPFRFSDGSLVIHTKKTPEDIKPFALNQPYMSGILTTYEKINFKYGYFEARIKIPSQKGTFPAFWLIHSRNQAQNTRRSEIDIFENLGHRPDRIYSAAHYYNNVNANYSGDHVQLDQPPTIGIDYSLDFHNYGVEWGPGYIIWYIDGQKVNEHYSNNFDFEEMYMVINLAMGGNWVNIYEWGGLGYNFPNLDDLLNPDNPQLEIDYVRVYKKN